MSVKQADFEVLGIELEITPDDEYEYLLCRNLIDNSHMLLRRSGDAVNIWNTNTFNWKEKDLSFRAMKNKDLLGITIVTSRINIVLPSKDQAYAQAKKDSN